MPLRLLHLRLRISTSAGDFGVGIPFSNGLFILHADNTSGKSTCLQSIVYALGLEGMLGPSRAIPLPPATTDSLEYDGKTYEVLESEVLLKISNGEKEITVRRQIKGEGSNSLITVFDESIQDQGLTTKSSQSYFVREPGSASRGLGFHTFLARFSGWDLPNVPTYKEKEVPLYMETLFPFVYVEQKHGWSNLRNRFPTYFGIKDVGRRALEFFLRLDAQKIVDRKVALKQKEALLRNRWLSKFEECSRLLSNLNGIIENLPTNPITSWPPSIQPRIFLYHENERVSISQKTESIERRIKEISTEKIPVVESVVDSSESKLEEARNTLSELELQIKISFEEYEILLSSMNATRTRISSLKSELSRSKDLKKLIDLGASQELSSNRGLCPTCQQSISDSLISEDQIEEPMTIDQNTEFIKEQLKVFEGMERGEVSKANIKKEELKGMQSYANILREEIRALKTTLTSRNDAPSYSLIEEQVRLEELRRNLESARISIDLVLGDFEVLSEEWNEIQSELKAIPKGILSDQDSSKLQLLEKRFQQQLSSYGFSSVRASKVTISENTYFPEYEGFDLQFDCSASDYIRLIWAYFLGLMEVAREYPTNHLGLLILDEPRQQSAREASIKDFLKRASQSSIFDQQVIIATSESRSVLDDSLNGIEHDYFRIDGRIIAPLQEL